MENTNQMTGNPATESVGVTETQIEISKDEFLAYEGVRVSGVTNMFMVTTVCDISGLDRDVVMEIMKNYTELANKFLEEKKSELKGCLMDCRVSSLTDETFICGETKLNGKPWLCDDCLNKLQKEGKI